MCLHIRYHLFSTCCSKKVSVSYYALDWTVEASLHGRCAPSLDRIHQRSSHMVTHRASLYALASRCAMARARRGLTDGAEDGVSASPTALHGAATSLQLAHRLNTYLSVEEDEFCSLLILSNGATNGTGEKSSRPLCLTNSWFRCSFILSGVPKSQKH